MSDRSNDPLTLLDKAKRARRAALAAAAARDVSDEIAQMRDALASAEVGLDLIGSSELEIARTLRKGFLAEARALFDFVADGLSTSVERDFFFSEIVALVGKGAESVRKAEADADAAEASNLLTNDPFLKGLAEHGETDRATLTDVLEREARGGEVLTLVGVVVPDGADEKVVLALPCADDDPDPAITVGEEDFDVELTEETVESTIYVRFFGIEGARALGLVSHVEPSGPPESGPRRTVPPPLPRSKKAAGDDAALGP